MPSPAEGSRGQQPVDSNLKDGLNPGVLIEVPVFSLPALCITASRNSGDAGMNTGPLGNSACCLWRKTEGIERSLSLLLLLLKGAGNTAHLKNFQNVGR